MPSVEITHADGSTNTIPTTLGWEYKREVGKSDRIKINVERSELDSIDLELKSDTVELDGVATGRLFDTERGGPQSTLVVYSFERDARRVEPLPGGTVVEGTDKEIITELVNDVGEWSVGSIAELTGPMSFVLNHATRSEALRRIEKNTPGELQWNDDGSVDYVENLGSDKSDSITLSAANQDLEGEIVVTDQGRSMDHTHLRVIGAHEGEAQLFATLVPSDDPASYENRVDYTTSRWSDGDPRDWGRVQNKDVSTQATIDEEAAALGNELKESLVEAEATVVGEDISVGDWVHVEKSGAGIDRDMRIHRITTRQDGATVTDDVLLSTRTVARTEEADFFRDVNRFNTSFQGASVAMNIGPHEDSVDGSNPTSFGFRYPDLEYENRAEIQVRGEEYRIDSQGAAGGGDHFHDVDIGTVTSNANTDSEVVEETGWSTSDVSLSSSSWTTADSFTINSPGERTCFNIAGIQIEGNNTLNLAFRVRNDTTGEYYPSSSENVQAILESDVNDWVGTRIDVPEDVEGNTLSVQAKTLATDDTVRIGSTYWTEGAHSHDVAVGTETSDASGDHVHEPRPGIYGTNDTPSNVDVLINGNVVATNIGSGTFQTEIDVGGEFDVDAWNEVEIQSDSLGDVQATVFLEGYDQIGTS